MSPVRDRALPTPFLLHHLLSRAALHDPDHEAVRCAGSAYTYRELEEASNGIANTLVGRGIRRGDRVGLLLPKRIEAVAAIYGILKAGASYVPLDPKAPASRVAGIAADCTIGALVTTPGRASAVLPELNGHRPRMVLEVDDGSAGADLGVETVRYADVTLGGVDDPCVPAIEHDLAYILYTSGSTGVPKGVMLSHRNALAFVEWCAATIGSGPEDRFSNHAPFHFDLSVFDLYVAALGGATLVLVPDDSAYFGLELARFIEGEGITVWYSVPSALMLLTRAVEPTARFDRLRAVVFAGEVYPTKHLRALLPLIRGAELWNLYGPTETNVVTYYRVGELPDDERTIPIGRACENTDVFVLTEEGRVAGIGDEGELYVRGPTVMRGYWGRPEKTAEMLVPNPIAGGPDDLVYRTGDLVRLRPDGDLDFLGRRDHQIKSRGYRIELGDVEAALHAHPSVLEAVAVPVPHEEWGTALVACVVPKGGAELGASDIKRFVAGRLPRYMVPARVDVVPTLPRTSNGKIDRRRVLDEVSSKRVGSAH